jgi:hypothetical protein
MLSIRSCSIVRCRTKMLSSSSKSSTINIMMIATKNHVTWNRSCAIQELASLTSTFHKPVHSCLKSQCKNDTNVPACTAPASTAPLPGRFWVWVLWLTTSGPMISLVRESLHLCTNTAEPMLIKWAKNRSNAKHIHWYLSQLALLVWAWHTILRQQDKLLFKCHVPLDSTGF